jgi:hypothetical protein
MPKIDGKVVRARYTALKLGELSAVDRPAQPGALATIMKRDDGSPIDLATCAIVAKYVAIDDGAHTFTEVLSENQFSEKIWPFTDALSQSIRSIVGDKRLSGDEREAKINESVASFLSKVREISPEVAKQLEGLVKKKDGPMPMTAEQLEAELAKANGQIETLTARAEKAEKDFADMKDAKDKAEAEAAAAKAEGGELATVKAELATAKAALVAATDETIKVDETEVRKSEVGEAQFKVTKALLDRAEMATLEKRADSEFRHVTGTATEKAKVLQVIEGIADEPTRKAAQAILASAEKMASGAFSLIGGNRGAEPTEVQKKAQVDYDAEVTKLVDGGMKRTEAMSKVRRDNPQLFEDANGGEAAQ